MRRCGWQSKRRRSSLDQILILFLSDLEPKDRAEDTSSLRRVEGIGAVGLFEWCQ
jgi:hypothetical protein